MTTATIIDTKVTETKMMHHSRNALLLVNFGNTLFFTDEALRRASARFGPELSPSEIKAKDSQIKGEIYNSAINDYGKFMRSNDLMHERLEKNMQQPEPNDVTIYTSNLQEKCEPALRELLRKRSMPYDDLAMRPMGLGEMADYSWKGWLIRKATGKYSQVYVYEDRLENLQYYKQVIGNGKVMYYHVQSNFAKRL